MMVAATWILMEQEQERGITITSQRDQPVFWVRQWTSNTSKQSY